MESENTYKEWEHIQREVYKERTKKKYSNW